MTRALLECDIAPDRSNTTKDCCMKRFSFKRRLLPANIQTRICSTTIICHHGEKQRKTIRSKAPPLILITADCRCQVSSVSVRNCGLQHPSSSRGGELYFGQRKMQRGFRLGARGLSKACRSLDLLLFLIFTGAPPAGCLCSLRLSLAPGNRLRRELSGFLVLQC